jgi:hypothetical protein
MCRYLDGQEVTDKLPADREYGESVRTVSFCLGDHLRARTRASFRRSTVSAMPAPITMRASVALKLAGAMQLIQVPMIAGASYTVRPFRQDTYTA